MFLFNAVLEFLARAKRQRKEEREVRGEERREPKQYILCDSMHMNSGKCKLTYADRKHISGGLGRESRRERLKLGEDGGLPIMQEFSVQCRGLRFDPWLNQYQLNK